MYKKYLALTALAATQAKATDDHWAVIVAGSNGFYNYRHQADTCHAYKIFKEHGIPEDQIIHMSYNDVAPSTYNPYPNKLFNKPTPKGTPGEDLYEGCKMHYTGNDVTAENVLKVLKGDATAPGPVLKSTDKSKVMFYFADHGAPGLIAMPSGPYLYANDFNDALEYMHKEKMYDEMTVYIEACESGSMFENILKDNLGIYAVSAANSHESSWGTYCSPDDQVDGVSIGSCLGDLFSVNWMEDADKAKFSVETLQSQFDTVQKETTKSHVLQWGQLTFTDEAIGEFEGDGASEVDWWKKLKFEGKKFLIEEAELNKAEVDRKNMFAVDSRDNKLHYLYTRYMRENTEENMKELQAEIDHRMKVDKLFQDAFPHHMEAVQNGTTPNPTDFDCYKTLINTWEQQCGKMSDYSLKYAKVLAAECEAIKAFPSAIDSTHHRITKVCGEAKAQQ